MGKTIRRYPRAALRTCGQKKSKYSESHKNGCYLKLTDKEVTHSDDSLWVVVDFDKEENIVGIEFVEGLPNHGKK